MRSLNIALFMAATFTQWSCSVSPGGTGTTDTSTTADSVIAAAKDAVTNPVSSSELFATQSALPKCDSTREAKLAYVSDPGQLFVCQSGSWNEVPLPQGVKGDKGDTGAKGDSGVAGKDGRDGSGGAGEMYTVHVTYPYGSSGHMPFENYDSEEYYYINTTWNNFSDQINKTQTLSLTKAQFDYFDDTNDCERTYKNSLNEFTCFIIHSSFCVSSSYNYSNTRSIVELCPDLVFDTTGSHFEQYDDNSSVTELSWTSAVNHMMSLISAKQSQIDFTPSEGDSTDFQNQKDYLIDLQDEYNSGLVLVHQNDQAVIAARKARDLTTGFSDMYYDQCYYQEDEDACDKLDVADEAQNNLVELENVYYDSQVALYNTKNNLDYAVSDLLDMVRFQFPIDPNQDNQF